MHSKPYQTILVFFFALVAVFIALAVSEFFLWEAFKTENGSGFFYGLAIDFKFLILTVAISGLYTPLAIKTIRRLSLKLKAKFQIAFNLATLLSAIYLVGLLTFKIIAETVVNFPLPSSIFAIFIVFLLTLIFTLIILGLTIIGTQKGESAR